MNRRWLRYPWKVVLLMLLVGIVPFAAGCRSMTGESLGQNIDDKTITATVKTKLAADTVRNLTAVDVDTEGGVVYLRGHVATAKQKRDAERIARSVDGVRRVVNDLSIDAPTGKSQAPTRSTPNAQAQSPAASPSTAGRFTGRHAVTGEVTKVDRDTGHVHLMTADGELQLYFPPSALRTVQTGDRVNVELALQPAR